MVATVTLSIEIELGWGRIDKPGPHPALSDGRKAETESLKRLLAVCDEHGVPITFDVVGHLLHEECDGYHEGPHPDGWFEKDPGTDVETDPHFYAPDFVEMILDAEVDHEIATHTYSHVLCDEVGPEVVDWELQRVKEIHEAFGLELPRSFVSSRHRTPPHAVLRDHGIDVIRIPFPEYRAPGLGAPGTFAWILGRTHPLGRTQKGNGITETYCTPHPSMTMTYLPNGQGSPSLPFQVISRRLRKKLHRRYLQRAVDTAVKQGGSVHLWTHLYNLANEAQWPQVRDALARLDRERSQGQVRLEPMADLKDTGVQ